MGYPFPIPPTARKGRPLVSKGGGFGVEWGEFPDPVEDPNLLLSGGYKSLTGAGETSTPGDLIQDGGFTVTDSDGDGIDLVTFGTLNIQTIGGTIQISATDNGAIVKITAQGSGGHQADGIIISTAADDVDDGGGSIFIGAGAEGGQQLYLGGSADGSGSSWAIKIAGGGTDVAFAGGVTLSGGEGPQVSGGTLAGVIAGLVALGWFSS